MGTGFVELMTPISPEMPKRASAARLASPPRKNTVQLFSPCPPRFSMCQLRSAKNLAIAL
eukprot:4922366-Amphidinium_carterae.1